MIVWFLFGELHGMEDKSCCYETLLLEKFPRIHCTICWETMVRLPDVEFLFFSGWCPVPILPFREGDVINTIKKYELSLYKKLIAANGYVSTFYVNGQMTTILQEIIIIHLEIGIVVAGNCD